MVIVNVTPHDIVVDDGNRSKTYPKTDITIRVKLEEIKTQAVDGFEAVDYAAYGVEGLPNEQPDVMYIVSALVLKEVKLLGRHDCIAPDTNNANRDSSGNIVSVPRFVR